MNWLKKTIKATSQAGEIVGTLGGLLGGAAVGGIEAGINKLNGMDNEAITKQWEKTSKAGQALGSSAGKTIGEKMPVIVAAAGMTIIAAKTAHGIDKATKQPKG